jgi:chromosome segregation ATPase
MSHLSLRARLRAKVSRTVEPIAHGLLAWSRAVDARVVAVEGRVDRVESEIEPIHWGRDALVERLNQTDAREELLRSRISAIENAIERDNASPRIAAIEDRQNQADWSRDAIVERLNFIDSRDEIRASSVETQVGSIAGQLAELERTIDAQASPSNAADLEALAMGRRLAALEDQVEVLLARIATHDDIEPLVSFPRAADDDREKAAG